jgi:AAA ATPase domain
MVTTQRSRAIWPAPTEARCSAPPRSKTLMAVTVAVRALTVSEYGCPMAPLGGTRVEGPALLERERQLTALERMMEAAQGGEGALLLVEGPAGAGKTALLEMACVRASEAGLNVLTASGGELEIGFPYGVVRQLFERTWAAFSADDRVSPRSGRAALADVVLSGPPASDLPAGEDGSFGVLHGLYWFVANLAAERPLALVIDDAHWADAASRRSRAVGRPRRRGAQRRGDGCGRRGLAERSGRPRDPRRCVRARGARRLRPGVPRGHGRQSAVPARARACAGGGGRRTR